MQSQHIEPSLTGTCASIGYSTSCCPWDGHCQATDGNCACGSDCHLFNDCCSDVACPTNPRTCADVGITQCCTSTVPGACEVRDGQHYCSCNVSCHARGDCCSDISTICVSQTCADAGKARGCCQTSSSSSCYIPGGNCYCDKYCLIFSDCCGDVLQQQCNSQITDPPNGSVIVDFEGAINVTTITCDIVNRSRSRESTEWSISNFKQVSSFHTLTDITAPEIFLFSGDSIPGPVPNLTYRNQLTILVFSNDLDRMVIFCGSNAFPAQAHFIFRIYRPPKLRKNHILRILEGIMDVTIDLHQDPAPFPEPRIFNWSKDGQPLSDSVDISLTYSNVTFYLVTRNSTGNYTVSATNFLLDSSFQQLGSDNANFYLDVLYPPSFVTEGSSKQYALLDGRFSLVCGTGLDSNPQATITWTAPDGTTIMDNTRYECENGPDVVRLNFMNTILSDAGVWTCDVTVRAEVNNLSGERSVLENDTLIGSISVTIQLMIIAPPGQPSIPTIESAGISWVFISWTAPPVAASLISYYEIIEREINTGEASTLMTTTNATNFNVTGLLPGISYELTIVTVSKFGNITARSLESRSVVTILTATPDQTVGFVDPPNGSVIVDFEGTLNVTTITCNIVNNSRIQDRTVWSISNFKGVSSFRVFGDDIAPELFLFSGDSIPGAPPTQTYQNRLTVLVLSSDLDHVMIACGNGTLPVQAYFVLRIYRTPNLHKNLIVRLQDGDVNIPVDLHQDPAPFPEPDIFNWSKDGQQLSADVNATYSTLTFSTVTKNSTGKYTVTATNFLLDNSSQQLGSDTGCIFLDVLYLPSFVTQGPTRQYILLGDSLSLVCGTGLDSNPQATITWTAPNGSTIMNNARCKLDNGPDIVRLNFTNTVLSDAGVWRCDTTVSSEVHELDGGKLIPQNDTIIGSLNVTIKLIIIAPPDQPSIPTIESSGANWVHISWIAPFVAHSPISYYEIIVRTIDSSEIMSTETSTNVTIFNVTGLFPGMVYELSMVAVSEYGNITARSVESNPVVIILTATPGQTVGFVDPPNGSVIVDFEGTLNVTTITCNIVNYSRIQDRTVWSISNFRGVSSFRAFGNDISPEMFLFSGDPIPGAPPTQTYQNRLTVLVLSSDLDHVKVACGNSTLPVQAYFVFRIYRTPNLHKNLIVRLQDGDVNIPVDLHRDPAPFPEPDIFNWSKDGQLLGDVSATYSTLIFSTVTKNSSGKYTVTATNFLLDNSSQQLGSDTGSIFVDVLYPPSFVTQGPTRHYILLGDSLSLVCGTGLDSNPQPTITWIAPDGITIVDNARYEFDNGPDIVKLNFTNTVLSDAGVWTCDATVSSEAHKLDGGKLIPQNDTIIGSLNVTIEVTIIAPPDQPSIPTIESSGANWVHISWTAPFVAHSPISYYEVIVRTVDSSEIMSTETNTSVTNFNITGLLPGTAYELTVVAVSEGGNVTARSPETDKAGPSVVTVVGGVFGAVCGIILIAILIIVGITFKLRKAVRNKPKAVHEDPVSTDSPQHQPQNLTKKSPDINSLELEQCPAYANASLNY